MPLITRMLEVAFVSARKILTAPLLDGVLRYMNKVASQMTRFFVPSLISSTNCCFCSRA